VPCKQNRFLHFPNDNIQSLGDEYKEWMSEIWLSNTSQHLNFELKGMGLQHYMRVDPNFG
jgi:hypothetical protein